MRFQNLRFFHVWIFLAGMLVATDGQAGLWDKPALAGVPQRGLLTQAPAATLPEDPDAEEIETIDKIETFVGVLLAVLGLIFAGIAAGVFWMIRSQNRAQDALASTKQGRQE